jgi:hypothetical protein
MKSSGELAHSLIESTAERNASRPPGSCVAHSAAPSEACRWGKHQAQHAPPLDATRLCCLEFVVGRCSEPVAGRVLGSGRRLLGERQLGPAAGARRCDHRPYLPEPKQRGHVTGRQGPPRPLPAARCEGDTRTGGQPARAWPCHLPPFWALCCDFHSFHVTQCWSCAHARAGGQVALHNMAPQEARTLPLEPAELVGAAPLRPQAFPPSRPSAKSVVDPARPRERERCR